MKDEEESSLELLLDTMCNTFGGVIFITIALVVIMSMTSSLRKEEKKDTATPEKVEELKTVLIELQEQLRQVEIENADLTEAVHTASSDPRLQMLEEIAVLETSVEARELQAEVLRKSLGSTKIEDSLVEKELLDVQNAYLQHSKEMEKEVQRRQEVASQLELLRQERKDSALSMVFTTLTESHDKPYFLIVQDGKIWRVGPDDNTGQPNEDVSFQSGTLEGGDTSIVCTPKEGKGIAIFEGETLTQEFTRCLTSLPKDRRARFWVPPESAEVFYALREKLKRSQIVHGFWLVEDRNSYTYQLTSKGDNIYEY